MHTRSLTLNCKLYTLKVFIFFIIILSAEVSYSQKQVLAYNYELTTLVKDKKTDTVNLSPEDKNRKIKLVIDTTGNNNKYLYKVWYTDAITEPKDVTGSLHNDQFDFKGVKEFMFEFSFCETGMKDTLINKTKIRFLNPTGAPDSITINKNLADESALIDSLTTKNNIYKGKDFFVVHSNVPTCKKEWSRQILFKINADSVNKTPNGFTYLNAVSFDFDEVTSSKYVGHLNIFRPDLSGRFGINTGIMKINHSVTGDGINTTNYYEENCMLNPLDNVAPGVKFLRHYNKFESISQNTSWSFYFQPTWLLVEKKDMQLYLHLHTEFFIDTWTTTSTISNVQQDTGIMTTANIPTLTGNLLYINKFKKSTADEIKSITKDTKLSFYYGLGLTLKANIWKDGMLFAQPTVGKATRYSQPNSISKTDLSVNTVKSNLFFHLTRFYLKQGVTNNLEAVLGVDVRGTFNNEPTYAAYIGLNIGLGGIKKLLN